MESAITSKGQATIPKAVRDHLHLKAGDKVRFFLHPDGTVVILPKLPVSTLRGMIKGRKRSVTLDEMTEGAVLGATEGAPPPSAMIGLDTNVLVRYFAEDDPVQSLQARELIERRLTEETPGYISIATMLELVWVLERTYEKTPVEVADAIQRTLQADTLVVESAQDIFTAMIALKTGRGSFADALIGALSISAGCTSIYTFDRKASRLPGFALL